MKTIVVSETTDVKLKALSKKRKSSGAIIRSKVAIIAELIEQAHKRELK
tara:strand:- start:272 stop:418 length:147 start_codon:yes stop_codon:yes gene_type:complete